MNVSYFLLSEGSSPFITTNDNPIHKAAHRNTDQLSISFSMNSLPAMISGFIVIIDPFLKR